MILFYNFFAIYFNLSFFQYPYDRNFFIVFFLIIPDRAALRPPVSFSVRPPLGPRNSTAAAVEIFWSNFEISTGGWDLIDVNRRAGWEFLGPGLSFKTLIESFKKSNLQTLAYYKPKNVLNLSLFSKFEKSILTCGCWFILLIFGNVCPSVCPSQGFAVFNVNHKRDLRLVELAFGKSCRRPKINLQGCVVGEGARLSSMPIGSTRVKISKVHQMNYRHLRTLIWAQKFFPTIVVRLPR